MKFCMPHWDALKAAVAAAGLSGFVSQGGEAAVKSMIDGKFDPLLSAHNSIITNVLGVAGLQVMQNNEDGSERCPMCFVKTLCNCGRAECAAKFEGWIQRAVDDELAYAKEKGFMLST